MLIRFVISNFLSFDEERVFNMLAGSFKTHKQHVYKAGKVDVLKASAIYGANGAGKSNFIKAIEFLKETVLNGFINKSVNNKKFRLNKLNIEKPISFEIEFSIDGKIYSYGASFNHITVVEEWLYESGINIEDKLIFERTITKVGKQSLKVAEKYKKTPKQKLLIELMEESLLKSSELFLGKYDDLKIDEISKVREWFDTGLIIIHPNSKFQLVAAINSSERFKIFVNELLNTFETGVTELGIENIEYDKFFGEEDKLKSDIFDKIENGEELLRPTKNGNVLIVKENNKLMVKKVITLHKDINGIKVPFDLESESDGTQRLLDFIPAFHGILHHDMVFIIDEIDQSLHPALLKALIEKVMADETTKGQLIFTTHESSLLNLDIFRQDEIWFVEKDKKTGGTQLYSLSEFKPRYDLDIRKGYLKGRFGAIPFLAYLEDLKWHTHDA